MSENRHFSWERDWVHWTCGVSVMGNFKIAADKYWAEHYGQSEEWGAIKADEMYKTAIEKIEREGTGYVMVGYIDTPACKEAEFRIGKLYKEVFRSETRLNVNSRNQFYFVIYDAKEKL